MMLLRLKTALRDVYAQMCDSAQAVQRKQLTPLLEESQSQYQEIQKKVRIFEQHTLPTFWTQKQQEFQDAVREYQQEFTQYVAQPTQAWYEHTVRHLQDSLENTCATVDEAVEQHLSHLTVEKSVQHIPSTDARAIKLAERKAETHELFLISSVSLGFATIGAFGFPLFSLLSGLGVLYDLWPILKSSCRHLKNKHVEINTLYVVVIGGLLLTGNFVISNLTIFLWTLAEKLTMRVSDDVHKNLFDVFQQYPDEVWIVVDGVEVGVPFKMLQRGDIVAVHAGEMIPIDGIVRQGMAMVDQHILTGEAQPIEKESGSQVFASTVVLSGKLRIEVEKAGQDTTVASIGRILNETVEFKTSVQLRSQTISDQTVLPTLVIGAACLPFLGASAALAFVECHFKARMNVTAPLSILNYFKLATNQGILIKDGRSLELLYDIDTIVFDKTGTLTQEIPNVEQIYAFKEPYAAPDILMYAAMAETKQSHPIAKAILHEAERQHVTIPSRDEAEYKIGYGLSVRMGEMHILVGSLRFMQVEDVPVPAVVSRVHEACGVHAHTLVFVAVNREIVGGIELTPALRPEVKDVLQQLRRRPHIKTLCILSGDHEIPTQHLAQELGMDMYFAEVLPQDKAALIAQLQQEGKAVCYIGDGINDAIALRQAHVSISFRGASTVATDSAQIVLLDSSLDQLNTLFDLAYSFRRNINVMFGVTLVPMLMGMGGVLFLHVGILPIVLFNKVALLGALAVALAPTLQLRALPGGAAQAPRALQDQGQPGHRMPQSDVLQLKEVSNAAHTTNPR